MRFELPWAFLLLPIIVFVAMWIVRRGSMTGTLRFSSVVQARNSGRSWRMRLRNLPVALRILALVLLTIGLARPQQGREAVRDVSKGIAVEMLIDRSGSMGEEFIYEGQKLNRLQAVKEISREFVLGDGKDLKGRPTDLVGMVTFARYADTVCPLTLSHGALDRFIENIHVATQKNEDGTAIGDGLALAAARLKTVEEQLKAVNHKAATLRRSSAEAAENEARARSDGSASASAAPATGFSLPDGAYNIKSKIIILLTDGQNNFGKRSPQDAARLAREWGIKVYAIGIGGTEAFVTIQTPLGPYRAPAGPGVDEPALKAIAAETGGAYWMAESAAQLHEIYKKIDELERTEIQSTRFVDYSERFYPFVLAALMALCLEQVLIGTILRRIP